MGLLTRGLRQKGTRMNFKKALRDLINTYSKENASDTPDFVLAEYMRIAELAGCV